MGIHARVIEVRSRSVRRISPDSLLIRFYQNFVGGTLRTLALVIQSPYLHP